MQFEKDGIYYYMMYIGYNIPAASTSCSVYSGCARVWTFVKWIFNTFNGKSVCTLFLHASRILFKLGIRGKIKGRGKKV